MGKKVSIPYRYYQSTIFIVIAATITQFQFLIGIINPWVDPPAPSESMVSIPYRYYQSIVDWILSQDLIKVSIPYRYYQSAF